MDDLLVSVLGEKLAWYERALIQRYGKIEGEELLGGTPDVPFRWRWKFASGADRIVGFIKVKRGYSVILTGFDEPWPEPEE